MPIEDRYQLEAEIGRGQSGVVYRARVRESGRCVAVKVFRREEGAPAGEGGAPRLEREAALLSRVRHPGVVRVVEASSSGATAWLVTELVDGESLQARLQREPRLGLQRTLSLLAQAARALAAAHAQGVVHRDVKPANLLVTSDGTLKITDFGVAGETGRPGGGARRYFLGTPAYVAPEQWLGKPLDGRADLYSLGVVLYRCLTGRLPHEGGSVREIVHRALTRTPRAPTEIVPTLPAAIDEVCLAALAREPADRYPDGCAMAEALERVVVPAGQTEAAAGTPIDLEEVMERTSPQRRRPDRRWAPVLRVSAIAATVLAAAIVVELALAPDSAPLRSAPAPGPTVQVIPPGAEAPPLEPVEPAAASGGEPVPGAEPGREPPEADSSPRLEAGSDPDPELIRRYAESLAPPARTPRPAAKRAPERPEPAPATERAPQREAREPATEAREVRETRAAILVRHPLTEGLMEVRVDGRREALRRIGGEGAAALPGQPVSALIDVEPGDRVVEVHLLSATERVDVSASWRARWRRGGFKAGEWELVRTGGGWSLVRGSEP
jgi:serine/threonine-protein kinase